MERVDFVLLLLQCVDHLLDQGLREHQYKHAIMLAMEFTRGANVPDWVRDAVLSPDATNDEQCTPAELFIATDEARHADH